MLCFSSKTQDSKIGNRWKAQGNSVARNPFLSALPHLSARIIILQVCDDGLLTLVEKLTPVEFVGSSRIKIERRRGTGNLFSQIWIVVIGTI